MPPSTGRPSRPRRTERAGTGRGGGAAVRLASFSLADGRPRPGLIVGDEIVDLSDPATGLPPTMAALVALGPEGLERARAAPAGAAARHDLAAVRRHAPVPDPPAILAIGMNYRAHVAELGREPPEWQYWFNKQRTAISGPGDPIVLPAVSDMVDYEGELALVVGPRCQNVPAARAFEVIAGFTVINDVTRATGSGAHRPSRWASRSTPTPPAVPSS